MERLERMNILGGENNESVKKKRKLKKFEIFSLIKIILENSVISDDLDFNHINIQ